MKNTLLKQEMDSKQLAIVAGEFDKKKKSKGIMYVLWWFFGGIGGHRYYMGDIGYAIGMTLTLGGLGVWTLVDVFLIGKRLEKINDQIEMDIIQTVNK